MTEIDDKSKFLGFFEETEDLSWEDYLIKTRNMLTYIEFNFKKEIIQIAAEKLVKAGVPKDRVCARLIEAYRGYNITADYIRRCLKKYLGEEVTRKYKKIEKNSDLSRNEIPNIPIELSATGEPITEEPDQHLPTKDFVKEIEDDSSIKRSDHIEENFKQQMHEKNVKLADTELKLEEMKGIAEGYQLELGKLREQLQEQKNQITELIKSVNATAAMTGKNNNNDTKKQASTNVKDSLEYKALESELLITKDERDQLQQAFSKQMKEHPEQTFQPAKDYKAEAAAVPAPAQSNGTIEAEFPTKDLSTFFLFQANKDQVFLTIENGIVTKWHGTPRKK